MAVSEAELRAMLKARKLKTTVARLHLLNVIADYGTAIPYSSIQQALKETDRVTLYRTLNTLLDKGIIHKALKDENDTYYALCTHRCSSVAHNHEHIHFKCSSCHEVSCVPMPTPFNVEIPDAIVNSIEIQVTGLCSKCQ